MLKCILSSLLPGKETARKSYMVSLELRSIKDLQWMCWVSISPMIAKLYLIGYRIAIWTRNSVLVPDLNLSGIGLYQTLC